MDEEGHELSMCADCLTAAFYEAYDSGKLREQLAIDGVETALTDNGERVVFYILSSARVTIDPKDVKFESTDENPVCILCGKEVE